MAHVLQTDYCNCKHVPRQQNIKTRCMLGDVVVMSYGIMYKWDPSAPQRIRQRRVTRHALQACLRFFIASCVPCSDTLFAMQEVYYKQKELILTGKRLLPATIAFDFDIQLPYKPLVAAFRRLDLFHDLAKSSMEFLK